MKRGYIGIRLGQCSCSGVEPILWDSDGGINLVGLWTACSVEVEEKVEHFVVGCDGLRETRERCGVNAGVGVEEALLFEGRTKEGVGSYTKMLDGMWKGNRRLMELEVREGTA